MGFGDIEKHDYKKYLTIYFTIYARIFEITSLEFYRPPRKISAVIVISPDFLSPLMLEWNENLIWLALTKQSYPFTLMQIKCD